MNHDKVRVFAISDIHETDITTLDPSGCDIAVLAGDIQGHTCSHHLKVDFGSRRIAEQIAWVNGTFLPWCAKYKDVDLLVAHATPEVPGSHVAGIPEHHYGSEVLREMILAKKPKACVCGHIHAKDHSPVKLGETLVMNVSRIHESRRKAEFPPRVFTIKKVDGVTEVHVKEGVM